MKTKPSTPNRFNHIWPGVIKMTMLLIVAVCLAIPTRMFGAFGYTPSSGGFIVDDGANLVFTVDSSGNMPSCKYKGTELNDTSKSSGIASGLSSTTVTATNTGSVIVIKCVSTATEFGNLTHYYVVSNGVDNIYMATYPTVEPSVGELRYIFRGQYNVLPNGPAPSDNNGGTGAIESSDVIGHADGTTTSKYYGDGVTHGKDRAMDLTYCGATGTGVGVWMVFGNRESSSGGPFFRDIENQGDGVNSDQEIYNYMNSGHNQTEAWRTNVLFGPYVYVFTSGATPTLPIDTSWLGTLGLTGWVGASGRGTVSGTVSGIPAQFQAVIGFANTTAQYWATVAANGTYTCSGMKPGTYTATLYQGELGVATSPVTVSAGNTTTLNLASTWLIPSTVFQLGDWDGTPQGFLNATNILGFSIPNFITMHPSDIRMDHWSPTTFTVGTDPISKFPSIQMRGTNTPTTIIFSLTSGQITNMTVRIGATCGYNGGRPDVNINGHDLGYPGAPSQPKSRSWTIGTYRGNNDLWTWTVPSGDLAVGSNTMIIGVVSGSSDLSPWLSAGWVYDAVELDGPSGVANTNPPAAPTGLTAIAGNAQVALNWTASSGAASYNVYRSTTSGGPYAQIATGLTTTSYTDTAVTNGTTYYYVVTAVNAYGESGYSPQVSATPTAPAAPAAPTNLTASAGHKKVTLNWTQSTSPNIVSNKVYRATVSGGPYTLITTIAATTTYANTGLTSGTTYYYVVTAVNSSSLESPYSNQASATAK